MFSSDIIIFQIYLFLFIIISNSEKSLIKDFSVIIQTYANIHLLL